LFIVAIIILYTMVTGYTMVVAASAAREGARALAVDDSDWRGAVDRASPGFDGRRDVSNCSTRDIACCRVTLRVPLRIPLLIPEERGLPVGPFTAKMRRERW